LQFIKNGQIIAILQIAIYKTRPNYCDFANYENSHLWGFLAIYKSSQIIAILQIAIYKNGQIIAIISN
jgi:hypothetical protein